MSLQELEQRQRAFFQDSKFDSLLLRNFDNWHDTNLFYFSGIGSEDCFLLLKKGKKPVLLSSFLQSGNLQKFSHLKVLQFDSLKQLSSFLRQNLGKKIGVNFGHYPVKNFEGLKKILKGRKLFDASELFGKQRAIKSDMEISKIKEACKVSEMAADYLENFFRQGITEIEVAEKIEGFFKRMNCGSAFKPIVAFKENSAVPHHENSSKHIEGNGILLLDFGAKFEGYCSDISRTYFVGKPSIELQGFYHDVFEAKKLAESLLVPKAKAKKIFLEIDAFLKKRLKKTLPHALGHGIGLQEHDFPSGISASSTYEIAEKQCFAIEPAVYFQDFGIRIEDNCVISASGAKMLTAAPKELISL
jgi:Xaa-Pro aminopeptidase